MYSYNNVRQPINNTYGVYTRPINSRMNNSAYNQGDRFIGGGFVGPLLLGGLAGYAIGNRPNYYPYPYPYPTPVYYNNYYYPYY